MASGVGLLRARDDVAGYAPPPRRGRRVVRRLAYALLAVILVLAVAGVVLWNVTPGVGDAPARTAAIVREQGGISDNGVPPARVSKALIATEDSRFYSHPGLDAKALARGVWSFLTTGELQGATLEAQLAKLLYEQDRSGFWRELESGVLAFKLDDAYSKQQILAMYLDAAYFGHGAYGVVKAARVYFGVRPDQLSWGQATLLAGLVNAPSAYDPTAHLHLARSRQRHVIDRLVATGVFTKAQGDAVFAEPLHPAVPFGG
jgi:penicillin-binding protein 1A